MTGRTRAPRPPSEQFWLGLRRRWRSFDGRSRRYEFGSFVLLGSVTMTLMFAIGIGFLAASTRFALAGFVVGFPSVVWITSAGLAVTVRRLHDLDRSGWYALSMVVPPLGVALIAALMAKDGGVEPNRFGSSPKYY